MEKDLFRLTEKMFYQNNVNFLIMAQRLNFSPKHLIMAQLEWEHSGQPCNQNE